MEPEAFPAGQALKAGASGDVEEDGALRVCRPAYAFSIATGNPVNRCSDRFARSRMKRHW